MDATAKKTALRMIPYGLYILTSENARGDVAAATVNWVTQAAFDPPLVVVGGKADSHVHALVKETRAFALNMLGKGQQALAFTFFKPAVKEGDKISGEPYERGTTGAPLLLRCPAYIEARVLDILERGDHSIVVGEVVNAGVRQPIEGRPDDAILWLKELGEKIFYGG